jgi:hypothetical protein
VLVVQLELHLEGAVGDAPTALEEVAYLLRHKNPQLFPWSDAALGPLLPNPPRCVY